jgi:hypothetical protein
LGIFTGDKIVQKEDKSKRRERKIENKKTRPQCRPAKGPETERIKIVKLAGRGKGWQTNEIQKSWPRHSS